MEHSPQTPASPEATAPTPNTKRAAFFERWNRRSRRRNPEAPQSAPETQQPSPETAPIKPERRSFGKNILSLIRGDRAQSEAPQPAPTTPEAPAPQPQSPEQTPQFDRATRMRRLARVIIANVLGQVNQEPQIAKQHGEAKVDTQSLIDATQNLQTAANTLGTTITQAQTTPAANTASSPDFGGWSGAVNRPERQAPPVEQAAADRIDRRLRRLEAAAEEHRSASVAAVGLGVLAVILTGAEYFGRKRADRKITRATTATFARQQQAIDQQRADFEQFRQEQPAGMDRTQRRNYYERLSTFTHQQAERTRETERELREVVIARNPEAVRTEPVSGEIFERRTWQPRKPERGPAAEIATKGVDREPQPLMRVESVERTEHQPGQQTGSAGTGFFGGGGGGIAAGTGPNDLAPERRAIDPNSPEARKLEALRRAEQARLQQNAWLYGAALVLALGAAVIATIFIG